MAVGGRRSAVLGFFAWKWRPHVRAEARLADTVDTEVRARLVEADRVRTARAVGLTELDVIVLPEADLTQRECSWRRLLECEEAAAGTGEAATERRLVPG